MNFCSAVSRSAKLEPRPDCMAMFQRSRCNAHLSFHVARWATDGEYSFLMDQLLSLPSPPGPRAPGLRSGPSGSVAGEHRFHQVWLKWLKFANICDDDLFVTTPTQIPLFAGGCDGVPGCYYLFTNASGRASPAIASSGKSEERLFCMDKKQDVKWQGAGNRQWD